MEQDWVLWRKKNPNEDKLQGHVLKIRVWSHFKRNMRLSHKIVTHQDTAKKKKGGLTKKGYS